MPKVLIEASREMTRGVLTSGGGEGVSDGTGDKLSSNGGDDDDMGDRGDGDEGVGTEGRVSKHKITCRPLAADCEKRLLLALLPELLRRRCVLYMVRPRVSNGELAMVDNRRRLSKAKGSSIPPKLSPKVCCCGGGGCNCCCTCRRMGDATLQRRADDDDDEDA